MSEVRTWKCDGSGCGAIRKDANKWWVVNHDPEGPIFVLQPFERIRPEGCKFHFCGLACALRKISELAGASALPTDH